MEKYFSCPTQGRYGWEVREVIDRDEVKAVLTGLTKQESERETKRLNLETTDAELKDLITKLKYYTEMNKRG